MDKQLSFELDVLSSGKQQYTSLKQHLSRGKTVKLKTEQTFIIKSEKNINKKREAGKSKKYRQFSLITKKKSKNTGL